MKRCTLLLMVCLLCGVAVAQPKYQARYWFDRLDSESIVDSSVTGRFHVLVGTSALSKGMHTLHVTVRDTAGRWSAPQAHLFYRVADTVVPQPLRYTCWFDNDFDAAQNGDLAAGSVMLNTTALTTGFHNVNILVQDIDGHYFAPQNALIFRVPDTVANPNSTYTCWFDQDLEHRQSGTLAAGTLFLDAAGLTAGMHILNMCYDLNGNVMMSRTLFYKSPESLDIDSPLPYTCWIDDDFAHRTSGQILSGTVMMGTDSIDYGIHKVHLAVGSTISTYMFYKPLPAAQIVHYEYWYNDEPDSLHTVVEVANLDTLDFMQLMTVPSIPIRSTYFHFNPNDGVPLVQPKNDFHFKAVTAAARFSEITKAYVDVTVTDTIQADTLERGTTRTIATPYNDTIHWFKLYAGVGDSLSFQASKGCTMQLFAPDGEMVMDVSGNKVLYWCGIHAMQNGTYYLAVHDADDTTGTLSVSYDWVYRYAVLRWDVHRVGNGGISSITFIGNGFNSLDTAILVRGTDTLPAISILRASNTKLVAAFDFEDADTGMYQGVFSFVDEDIFKGNFLAVEPPRDILLERKLDYSPIFVQGASPWFTFQVTNTGNMTAYAVPLHLCIKTKVFKNSSDIHIDGLNLPSAESSIDTSGLSKEEIAEVKEWGAMQGDGHYLFRVLVRDTIANDSTFVMANYFPITLAPNETKKISVYVVSFSNIGMWASIPDSITPLKTYEYRKIYYRGRGDNSKGVDDEDEDNGEMGCCIGGLITCSMGFVSDRASVAAAVEAGIARLAVKNPKVAVVFQGASVMTSIAGCITGAISTTSKIITTAACDNSDFDMMDFSEVLGSISSTALGCLASIVGYKNVKENYNAYNALNNGVGSANSTLNISLADLQGVANSPGYKLSILDVIGDIVTGLSLGTKSNCFQDLLNNNTCDPNTPAGAFGAWMAAVSAWDPNDIYGYVAESGSRYVGEEQMELPYIIEFENDTAFATAMAHTVVVTDTLDPQVFDLASFSATAFGIGDKIYPLDGGKDFLQTVDLRPALDVLAEVRLQYNERQGIAKWIFRSLDPLTLEETTDPMRGFLPANYHGDGVGEVHFTINRKDNLRDGDTISNSALIFFDNEDPIATPVWHNIMDVSPPQSEVDNVVFNGDSATLKMVGVDNLSGIWRYHVHGMRDSIWYLLASDVAADTMARFAATEGLYDGFRTVAVDSAGNVESLLPPTPSRYDTISLTGCDIIVWRDSLYTATGVYTQTVHGSRAGDADTVHTLLATVNYSGTGSETVTACDSYDWKGETYTASGVYAFDTLTVAGCDSTITLTLTVNYSTMGSEIVTACNSYVWHGTEYTASTDEPTYMTTNSSGCDSTVTLNLTINYSTESTVEETINENDLPYTFNGEVFDGAESRDVVINNLAGCDSTIHYTLNVNWNSENTDEMGICASQLPYTWNGVVFEAAGTRSVTLYDIYGADSVVIMILNVYPEDNTEFSDVVCMSYLWNNTTYSEDGDHVQHFENQYGCDSTVTLHLTVNTPVHMAETVEACESYTWNNTEYFESDDYTFAHTDAHGCNQVDTLHLTVNYSCAGSENVTACDSYNWKGSTYTASGAYTFDTLTAAGCDSIVTLTLTVNYSTTGDTTATACDQFAWHGTTYTVSGTPTYQTINAAGCDSIVTLTLTVNYSGTGSETVTACDSYNWKGSTYTASGVYTFDTLTAAGCDSVVTLTLTVNYSGTGSETVTACDSYNWKGSMYTASGVYTFDTLTAAGCDSVVTLTLTVNHSGTGSETVTTCDSYNWKGSMYTASGVYTFDTLTAAGCDSVVTLTLTVNYSGTGSETMTACNSYNWKGSTYTASGVYTFDTLTAADCDSVVSLNLTVNHSGTGSETMTACDSYDWKGSTYTASGVYTFDTLTVAGCDSTVTLNLTVNYSGAGSENVTACDSYDWKGSMYTASGVYTFDTLTAAGCDSVVTLTLTVNYSTTGDTTATACDQFAWHGTTYIVSGTPTYQTVNAAGCDSTVTLHLTVNYSTTGDSTATACDQFAWHGTTYTVSGTPTYQTVNAAGCDSTVTLHLTVNYSTTGDTTATACDEFAWHGTTYTVSSTPTYQTVNAAGCDSTVTLHLTVNYSTTGDTTAIACDQFAWHGTTYTVSGTPTYQTINAAGCDSTVTLHLTVNYSTTGDTTAIACDQFAWHGTTYTVSDTPTYQTINAAGCDSTVTLHLTVNYSTTGDTTATACDQFEWHGTTYTVSGTPTYQTANVAGCDSTVTLNLTINYSSEITITDTAEGSYVWNGSTYTESGTYQWQGTTDAGCDSTVTLLLVVNSVGIEVVDGSGIDVMVYPNPTEGWITIDAEDVLSVEVFDQAGHKVATHKHTNRIDLSSLPVGGYLLKIHLQRGSSVQRVILK